MKSQLYGFLILTITLCNWLQATPVSENGALKRQGSKIVGSHGNQVQIAGPSLYWSIWGGEKFYNNGVIGKIAGTWNASLVRASIAVEHEGGYLGNSKQQLEYAKTVVNAAIESGIYVLVDWHDHNANIHINEAKAFFSEMAKTYKNSPNVIWEIWNEPDNEHGSGAQGYDTWTDIRNYANSVISVIREHSSNLIVVGTPRWSADPASAAANPLEDSNVAYSLHFYAGTHGADVRSNAETAMSKGLAIFITEFGTTDHTGGQVNKKIYLDKAKEWLDWADFKGISWANWSLSSIPEPCSIIKPGASTTGNWTDNDLSESGKWIRDRLLARPKTQSPDSARIIISTQGKGSVTVSPNKKMVKKGTEVTFTAVPENGWAFKSWGDASTATEKVIKITVKENTSLVANFAPGAGTNMIKNGDFSSNTSWISWVDTSTGNKATCTFEKSQANISIASTDTLDWGIQLSQSGLVLDSGDTYIITLDAWSTGVRPLNVALSTLETWHYQGGSVIDLSAEKKTATITVTPDSSTDVGVLQINAGGSTLPVYIDNVHIRNVLRYLATHLNI